MSERTLAVELVGVLTIETITGIREEGIPKPSRYVGAVVVFGMLAALAAVGDSEARLASALGGVVLLAILLSPSVDGTRAQSVAKGLGVGLGSNLPSATGTPGGPIGVSTGISSTGLFTGPGGAPVQQGPSVP